MSFANALYSVNAETINCATPPLFLYKGASSFLQQFGPKRFLSAYLMAAPSGHIIVIHQWFKDVKSHRVCHSAC